MTPLERASRDFVQAGYRLGEVIGELVRSGGQARVDAEMDALPEGLREQLTELGEGVAWGRAHPEDVMPFILAGDPCC